MKYTALFLSAMALMSGAMGFQTPSMPNTRESKTSLNIFNRKSSGGGEKKASHKVLEHHQNI